MLPLHPSCIHLFMRYLKTTSSAQGLCDMYNGGHKGQDRPCLEEANTWGRVEGTERYHWEMSAQPRWHFQANLESRGGHVLLTTEMRMAVICHFQISVFKKLVCLLHAFIFHLLDAKESRSQQMAEPHKIEGAWVPCSGGFKIGPQGITWWSSGYDSVLWTSRAWVQSLLGELRSHKPAAKKKKTRSTDSLIPLPWKLELNPHPLESELDLVTHFWNGIKQALSCSLFGFSFWRKPAIMP